MQSFIEILKQAVMITSFVFIMMLVIEYVNVVTKGNWQNRLQKSKFGKYILAAFFGALPGCLGSFTVVSLYSHEVLSFGALVGTMIATSGDEAYVMFSLFPEEAFALTLFLFVTGVAVGYLTDKVLKNKNFLPKKEIHDFKIHKDELCDCFNLKVIINQLKNISFERLLLLILLTAFLFMLVSGQMARDEEMWIRVTFFLSISFSIYVTLTVPEHFLDEHLWKHLVKKHLLRIFLWTFGALLFIYLLSSFFDVHQWIRDNYVIVLLLAAMVGIIPESGPHLIFVTLFAAGAIPFSILLTSSIVQDGHGTIPLLAVSKKGFVYLKIINVIVGVTLGLIGLSMGL
ncbi:MAG: hypothetical protein GXO87_01120 [Chlorobi bacterium]|nr:hypothetical protein [Chlorobiota bacterium]